MRSAVVVVAWLGALALLVSQSGRIDAMVWGAAAASLLAGMAIARLWVVPLPLVAALLTWFVLTRDPPDCASGCPDGALTGEAIALLLGTPIATLCMTAGAVLGMVMRRVLRVLRELE